MAFRNPFKALFAPPAGDAGVPDACLLFESEAELDKAIAARDKLMVLFYASWCPFSQNFLKTFREHAAAGDPCYARIIVDNGDPVVEKYGISVFPTVLFFERGQLSRRLDGIFHRGLSRDQLADFARRCAVK
jgi:thioredoxin-like negative regulator of GroEL